MCFGKGVYCNTESSFCSLSFQNRVWFACFLSMEGCRRDWNKVKKKITRCIAILHRDLPDIYTSEYPTKVRQLISNLNNVVSSLHKKRCLTAHHQCFSFIHCLPVFFLLQHIFIGNAGLTTNADESSLVELITSVGCGLEALTLLPGKQYSFASFTTPEQARTVMLAAHGHLGVRGSTSPVYMAYVDKGKNQHLINGKVEM